MPTKGQILLRGGLIATSAILIFVLGVAFGVHQTYPGRDKQLDVAAVYGLRLLGLELKDYSNGHEGKLPATLTEMHRPALDKTGTDPLDFRDPLSQIEFKYVGGGRLWDDLGGDGILAYTSNHVGDEHQYALFSGGYVIRLSNSQITRELAKIAMEQIPGSTQGANR